jgi:hypothetical protein
VRFVHWDASGHQLLTVDDLGMACVWAMVDHASNAWACTYTHDYGRAGVVAVEMLRPRVGPQCMGWMVVTGDGAVHVAHQDPRTREYIHAAAPLVDARVGARLACIALGDNGVARVACVGGGQAQAQAQAGIRVYDVQVLLDAAPTKVV